MTWQVEQAMDFSHAAVRQVGTEIARGASRTPRTLDIEVVFPRKVDDVVALVAFYLDFLSAAFPEGDRNAMRWLSSCS
jgi:hypothetical protein